MLETELLSLAPLVAAVFLLAGLVKGLVGLGLPTIAMGLLAVAMPPATAAAVLLLPSFVTNLWQMLAGPHFNRLARRLWPMLLGVVAGTLLGTGWMSGPRAGLATLLLGVVLVVYAALGLGDWRLSIDRRRERWFGAPVGLATGLVTAATGVFVVPAVPYLQSLELDKDELVQALGIAFMVSTIALALNLAGSAALSWTLAGPSLVALVAALAGMAVGQRLRARLDAVRFRRLFMLGLLALGLYLAARALL